MHRRCFCRRGFPCPELEGGLHLPWSTAQFRSVQSEEVGTKVKIQFQSVGNFFARSVH